MSSKVGGANRGELFPLLPGERHSAAELLPGSDGSYIHSPVKSFVKSQALFTRSEHRDHLFSQTRSFRGWGARGGRRSKIKGASDGTMFNSFDSRKVTLPACLLV